MLNSNLSLLTQHVWERQSYNLIFSRKLVIGKENHNNESCHVAKYPFPVSLNGPSNVRIPATVAQTTNMTDPYSFIIWIGISSYF